MKNESIGFFIHEEAYVPNHVDVIESNSNRVIAESCLQEGEEQNRNGRCYKTADLIREQNCPRTRELLEKGYMLGEAGHPMDDSIVRQQTIDPKTVAIRYHKFWMDGNKWMATYSGTNNSLGDVIDKDLRCGYKPAFSMRSLGTLKNIGGRNLVQNLKYITHDFVIFPSHPGAYTTKTLSENAVLQESVNMQSGKFNCKPRLIPIMNEEVISYIKNESANIQSVLNQFDCLYESVAYNPKNNNVTIHTRDNDVFIVNCESYIQKELEDYCSNYINNW